MIARSFEDLIFWQKARELTQYVYSCTRSENFRKDFGLKDQVQRSCVSVMSNIAEGFGRGGNKEFIQFLFIAKGSLSEIKSQLYVAMDLDYISPDDFNRIYGISGEISRLINAFIRNIKLKEKRGLKNE